MCKPVCLLLFALAAALIPALPLQSDQRQTTDPFGVFHRPLNSKPIISPNPKAIFTDPVLHTDVHWEALHTFNPAAVVRGSKVSLLYRAEDNSGAMQIGEHTSRLGLAESTDGIHFVKRGEPVFYPSPDSQQAREWPGGVEDPRLVEAEDGTYILAYTQWNRKRYDIGIATSRDLLHWQKFGPAFGTTGKYADLQYKSAGILTRLVGERIVAAKLKGKYWMYWGEIHVGLATSDDLIHWSPVEDSQGKPLALLSPRPDKFDSDLPEVGPPPVLTEKGIVMLYNGKNAATAGDPSLPAASYSMGSVLFSADDPGRVLSRSSTPIFQPEQPWEKSGQYQAGTTFGEGLVRFQNQWFLYYGCADSLVGVALAR
jgi:beta-1,2-mannosidase